MTTITQQMKNASLHLEAVFASALDAMIVTDAQGVIEMFNHAAEQMFGYRAEELIGMNVSILMPMPDSSNHQMYMGRYVETRQSWIPRKGREVIAKRRSGENFFAEITLSDVLLEKEIIFTAIIRDITTQKAEKQKIVRLAFFDQETNLPNVYYLHNKLEDCLKDAQGQNYLISLYLGELTNYINIFGSQGVKDVTIVLADFLRSKLPSQTVISRCGSKHLKILYVTDSSKPLSAEQIAEQLENYLRQPLKISDNHIFLNITFGIAQILPQQDTVRSVLDHVDIALHIATQQIAKNYAIFKPEFEQALHRRAVIVQKLYQAMHKLPFELYLQPQISLATQQVIGAEALIRWRDVDGSWISPAEFIPIAETIGLIKELTLWTLQKACSILKNWKEQGKQPYRIAVNMSAQVVCTPTFVADVTRILQETGINPQELELEITETALMANLENAIKTMKELSALQISISIDDFGTGLSSLAYLKLFNIDRLKIDQSFVTDIVTNRHDQTMVGAIIKFSHELGYQVVCEGVENQAQLNLIAQLDCDEIQGYYFAKPMPCNDFFAFAQNFKFAP